MEDIVKFLISNDISISTMESCTGGLLASFITDVVGASAILKFSAVTYSSEYKIKMGVNEDTINKYSVYSKEVAKEMAYNIAKFSNSTLGVGITGKLSTDDNSKKSVDLCIYDTRNQEYYHVYQELIKDNRHDNKLEVISLFIKLFNSTIILNNIW